MDSRLDHFLPFLWRVCARPRYDLVVNLHPSAKSYLMAAASGARTRLTFRKRMEVQPETGRVAHAVDDFAKELRPLGIGPLTRPRAGLRRPGRGAASGSRHCWPRQGVAPTDRLLVINPAASRPLNRWPLERFAEVAAHSPRSPASGSP